MEESSRGRVFEIAAADEDAAEVMEKLGYGARLRRPHEEAGRTANSLLRFGLTSDDLDLLL